MVFAFQNCGNNMSFQQDGALVAKADVDTNGDGIPDDPTSDDSNNTDDNTDGGLNPGDGSPPVYPTPRPPGASPSPSPAPGTPPGASPTPRPGYGGGGHDDDDDHDHDDKDCDNDDGHHGDGDHSGSSSKAAFVCILEGPGKSVKLGLRTSSLAAGNSADQAVCMSQNACLNIASKAFSVKMADRRGFCKHSSASGRVSMTDAQMEEAVSKAKVLQMSQEY
jgi:hypothetical protein